MTDPQHGGLELLPTTSSPKLVAVNSRQFLTLHNLGFLDRCRIAVGLILNGTARLPEPKLGTRHGTAKTQT
jgi:hypothetical protein